MVNTSITTWLQGNRNYAEGLELLKRLQPGSLTVLILEAGDDDYNQNLLIDEIKKHESNSNCTGSAEKVFDPRQYVDILHNCGSDSSNTESSGISTSLEPRNTAADTEKRITLKKEAGRLWQEMAHTKGSMALLRGGKALHRQARSLLLLNEKRQRIWDEIDFFDENGYWHGEKTVAVNKPANLEQLIKNQMTYRTKAEKELARPQIKSKREYLEGRIAKFNAEIDRLKSLREVKHELV